MTAVAARALPAEAARVHSAPGGGRLTLERRLERVWEGLLAAGVADCPVCGGRMRFDGRAGRCVACRSSLA